MDTAKTTKDATRAAEAAYRAARRDYEDGMRVAQGNVTRALRGDRVGGQLDVDIYTWTVRIGSDKLDVAGATAEVTSTTDEKKPVQLTVRDPAGRPFSSAHEQKRRRVLDALARQINRQSIYAQTNADLRQAGVTTSVHDFNEAVARTSEVAALATEYSRLANLGAPRAPAAARLGAAAIADWKPNSLVRELTAWLPGSSPTVRRYQIKVAAACAAAAVLIGGCFAWGSVDNRREDREPEAERAAASGSVDGTPEASEEPRIEYTVVHRASETRYDGGDSVWVLIGPVNLSSNSFQSDIESLVRVLVDLEGSKSDIEFHDDPESLEVSWREHGELSLSRPRTDAESSLLARHYIAAFSGDLDTGPFLNTMYWFPTAFRDYPQVGPYVDIVDFDP